MIRVSASASGGNADTVKVVKYFLLGNPVVYWGSTASLGVLGLLVAWYLVRWQRGYDELKPADIDQIHYAGLYPVLGWFLHYVPFIAMARVTYVHHYVCSVTPFACSQLTS